MKRYRIEVLTSISSQHRYSMEILAPSIEHAALECRHYYGVRITRRSL